MFSSGSSVPSAPVGPSSARPPAGNSPPATPDEAIMLALEALHAQSPARQWFSSAEIATSLLGQCPQPTGLRAPMATQAEASQLCVKRLAADRTLRASKLVRKSSQGRFGLTALGREGARDLITSFEIGRQRALETTTATPKITASEAVVVRQLLEQRAFRQHWRGGALSLDAVRDFYAVDRRSAASSLRHVHNCVQWVQDLLRRAFDAVTMRVHKFDFVEICRLRLAESAFRGALLPA